MVKLRDVVTKVYCASSRDLLSTVGASTADNVTPIGITDQGHVDGFTFCDMTESWQGGQGPGTVWLLCRIMHGVETSQKPLQENDEVEEESAVDIVAVYIPARIQSPLLLNLHVTRNVITGLCSSFQGHSCEYHSCQLLDIIHMSSPYIVLVKLH